jgi:hypothetical protein
LISPTGLGCVSTAMGEAEVEYFLEVLNASLQLVSDEGAGKS